MPGRLLRLLSLLQSRREWSGGELAERLGVTDRTVRRDVDRLRALGYPVDGTTGTAGGYRLASGRNLPPLLLEDDEAVAVAVGLRTAAGGTVAGIDESSVRALAKLEQVLPTRLRHQIAAIGTATIPVLQHSGRQVDSAALAVLASGCRDHEVVSFDYQGRDGVRTARRVEPHSLVNGYGRWYLIAYDLDRADWRTFRVDRLSAAAPTRVHCAPRTLPAPDVRSFLARTITEAPYKYTAEATVDAPAETVTARLAMTIPGRISAIDEHTCTVRLGADSLDVIAQQLVALGADFTVDGPAELLGYLRTVGRRLLGTVP